MPYVKPDGTKVYADGSTGRLTPQEMDFRDRYNEWVRLPEERRMQTPMPPEQHDSRAGLMQRYLDKDTEKRIAARLNATRAGGGQAGSSAPLLRGLLE